MLASVNTVINRDFARSHFADAWRQSPVQQRPQFHANKREIPRVELRIDMFSNWQQFGLHLALSTHENRRYNLVPHPLWARRRLLFQEDNREQHSDTTDSRPIHHRQLIATYRPRYRPDDDRHTDRSVDRQSADLSTEYRPICRPTYRSVLGRHVGRLSVDTSAEGVHRERSLLHVIQIMNRLNWENHAALHNY